MTKELEWTKEEFILMMCNTELSDEELSVLLPNRSHEAVGVIRAGVHNFHTEGDISMLSEMMKELLGSKDTIVICPICKVSF